MSLLVNVSSVIWCKKGKQEEKKLWLKLFTSRPLMIFWGTFKKFLQLYKTYLYFFSREKTLWKWKHFLPFINDIHYVLYFFNRVLSLPSWHSRRDKTYPSLHTHLPSSHTTACSLPWHCLFSLQYPPIGTLTNLI